MRVSQEQLLCLNVSFFLTKHKDQTYDFTIDYSNIEIPFLRNFYSNDIYKDNFRSANRVKFHPEKSWDVFLTLINLLFAKNEKVSI